MKIKLLFLFAIIPSFLFAQNDLSQWSFQLQLNTKEQADFYQWEIPPSVYAEAQSDFDDFRLITDDGKEHPWFIEKSREQQQSEILEFSYVITGKNFDEESSYPWVQTVQIDIEENQQVNRLQLVADLPSYSCRIKLYGRNDQGDWVYIMQDTLYNNEVGLKDFLVFPGNGSGHFTLYYGNDDAQRPEYDLMHFKQEILEKPLGRVEAGDPVNLSVPSLPEKGFPWNRVFLFSMVLVGGLMIFVIVKVLKSSRK